MVPVKIDMTGWVMSEHGIPDSRLTVIKQVDDYINPNGTRSAQWLCECNCKENNKIVVRGTMLRSGKVLSCGCLQKEKASSVNSRTNPIDFDSEEYAIGYTLKGEPFWFDKEDYDKIKDYYWRYDRHGYVITTDRKTHRSLFLHNLIMGPIPDGMEVDHKKHPPYPMHKIDNRKENLEFKTRSQNMMNQSLSSANTSGTTGVSWHKRDKVWRAYIQVNGQHIHLGYFPNKEDAIKARKEAEQKYFGQYSYDANNPTN